MHDLTNVLGRNPYPGRGILIGRTADGAHAVCAYFIMGRSVNSRNRVFVPDGDGIRTQTHDPSKMTDPSLIIYAPVKVVGPHTLVTNGDQTDTITRALLDGQTFEAALRTREFEPDAPNYTPRVSGILTHHDGGFSYTLSILKSADGDPACCQRFFYEYEKPLPGQGHLIHTYRGDGNPLPSFAGDPTVVGMVGGLDALTDALWENLNEENKVSLFVRFIRLADGAAQTRIVNKWA